MARSARRRRLSPVYLLRTQAITKGFLGGQSGWRTFGIAYFGLRFLKRLLGKNEEVLIVEELAPGQRMHITALAPPEKRSRRSRR